MLTLLSRKFAARLRKQRVLSPYQLELIQWRKVCRQTVNQYRTDFWQLQSRVENEWIETYNEKVARRANKFQQRRKESVINIATHTTQLQQNKQKQQQVRQANLYNSQLQTAEKLRQDTLLVQKMNADSKNWLTPGSLDEKLKDDLILPHSLEYTDYYRKLKEDAAVHRLGLPYGKKDLYNNRVETRYRNMLLHPHYVDMKSTIKKLTFTPAHDLEQDFEAAKKYLIDNPEGLRALREKYLVLWHAVKAIDKEPENFLMTTHKQLALLEKLVSSWDNYIKYAKMNDNMITLFIEDQLIKGGLIEHPADENVEEEWDDDMKGANIETSDYFEEEKVPKDDFLEIMRMKEEAKPTIDFSSVFAESDEKLPPGSDIDMYTGENVATITMDTDAKIVEAALSIEQLLDNIEKEYGDKDIFEDTEQLPEGFKEDYLALEKGDNRLFVLVGLKERINEMSDKDISLEDRWRKDEILKLIDRLNSYKIQEPHLLIKIFKHHRYDPVRFSLN